MNCCGNCKQDSFNIDLLAFTLGDMGVQTLDGISDEDLLALTAAKLRVLYRVCVAAGVSDQLLRAIMSE